MHSWLPYAKQPIRAARSRLQGDGGRKFKVGTEKERETERERERERESLSGPGFRGLARGRGMHLALNSGHDGWFPDVIQ